MDVIVSKVRPSNFQKLCASIRNPKYRLFIICIMLMAAAMEVCMSSFSSHTHVANANFCVYVIIVLWAR